jgi:hypothetical protein
LGPHLQYHTAQHRQHKKYVSPPPPAPPPPPGRAPPRNQSHARASTRAAGPAEQRRWPQLARAAAGRTLKIGASGRPLQHRHRCCRCRGVAACPPPPPPPARSVLLGCLRSSGWGARADLSPLCVQLTGADDEPLPDPSHARRGDRLGCARCAPPPRPLPRLPSACSSLLRLCSVRRSKRQPQLRRFTSVLTRCCAACAQGKVLAGRRPMAAPVMR